MWWQSDGSDCKFLEGCVEMSLLFLHPWSCWADGVHLQQLGLPSGPAGWPPQAPPGPPAELLRPWPRSGRPAAGQ